MSGFTPPQIAENIKLCMAFQQDERVWFQSGTSAIQLGVYNGHDAYGFAKIKLFDHRNKVWRKGYRYLNPEFIYKYNKHLAEISAC